MAKKSIGFTHLIWTCPNCKTRNPGPQKLCLSCGAHLPKDVQFEQADQEDLIQETNELERAKTGADIHCPFCGARNPADAKTCSQCLGDLSEGHRREHGRVLGAHKNHPAPPLICPACKSENLANSMKCAKCGSPLGERKKEKTSREISGLSSTARMVLIGFGIALFICVAVFLSRSTTRDELVGRVSQANWERSIQVMQFLPVVKSDWWDEMPDEADVNDCKERFRYSSDQLVEGSIEVCGTPYTVDQGSGYGEVVQDCRYEVYDYFCEYEIAEWAAQPPLIERGSGYNAVWPSAFESSTQKLGERGEMYTVVFQTDDGIKRFTTNDYNIFQQAQIGSEWELVIDGFGNVKSISRR